MFVRCRVHPGEKVNVIHVTKNRIFSLGLSSGARKRAIILIASKGETKTKFNRTVISSLLVGHTFRRKVINCNLIQVNLYI